MTNLAALPSKTELASDYRIDRVLGAGGFGITYLAHEIALDRRVTIKEYFPTDYAARAGSHEASPRSKDCANDYRWGLNRFIEEAQTLAKFNHPHIVRVYRYFKENNTGYMVLHFEEGQSFKNWLKGLGRAPRQKELDAIIEPLLDALDLIHKQDFLHRDIAPDNIIIRKDGSPVLIDFGSARGDIAAQSKTVSALVKPGYSPYEQYAETSRQQGPWTDIYALGATLYHASTGRRPPDAPSRMVNDEYRSARDAALSSYRPRFLRAIDASLALNVESRPQSIGAWRGELLAPETKTKPKKSTRRGWLTRRGRNAEPEAPANELADIDTSSIGTVPIPPPPDAPGPRGGIVNFVDNLKNRPKREGLAQALARVQNPEKNSSNAQGAPDNAGAGGPVAPPAHKSKQRASKKSAPLDASPHARTQRYTPADDAPIPPTQINAPTPDNHQPEQSGNGPIERAPAKKSKRRNKPRANKNALALRQRERRRPANPRPMATRSRSSWASFATKALAGATLAGILIANRDRLPDIDIPALMASLSTPSSSQSASKTKTSRKIETAAINKRNSDRRSRTHRAKPAPQPPKNPLLRQTKAHEDTATAMAYSPGGKTLITVSKDRTLKVWNAKTGAHQRTIQLQQAPATALSIQGSRIAVGHEDGLIEVFDFQSGSRQASMQRNEAAIWSLAFTNQSGRLAAASHDWKIALWDVAQPHAPIHILEGHENSVQALASAAGHPYLATGGADRRVKLWNLDTFDLVRTYPRQSDFITALTFSPDGKKFASATLNGDIRIWSVKSRRLLKRLRGHKGAIKDLSFSPSGTLLSSAGSDGTVRIWNVRRGRTIKTLASHTGVVNALGFSPDGSNIASIGDDGRLRLWSTEATHARR